MAKGSLKDPFKNKDDSPMKQVSGSAIGTAGGAILGSIIPGVGTAIGGAVGGVIGGLFDSSSIADAFRGRRDETPAGPSQAEQDLNARMQAFEDYTFRTTNPYEDMTVNTQAAEFQRDMQAQRQADTLQALRGARGSAGAASLATAMSRQAAEKERAIAADIGKQEQAIQMAQAKQEAENQKARQAFELDRMTTMLGISMAEVTGQEQARLAADQARMNRGSQLLGAGINILGTLGSSFIESGGLQPKTSTTSTPTQFADLSDVTIDTSGLGKLSL